MDPSGTGQNFTSAQIVKNSDAVHVVHRTRYLSSYSHIFSRAQVVVNKISSSGSLSVLNAKVVPAAVFVSYPSLGPIKVEIAP